jgi:hypothetical protein
MYLRLIRRFAFAVLDNFPLNITFHNFGSSSFQLEANLPSCLRIVGYLLSTWRFPPRHMLQLKVRFPFFQTRRRKHDERAATEECGFPRPECIQPSAVVNLSGDIPTLS